MTIGNSIAQARREAGLTIAQVSGITRIRGTIISAIERDDFAPCGGDFYARGHIRAIARVVGLDSRPLIEEYDTGVPAVGTPDPPTETRAETPGETTGARPAGTTAVVDPSDEIGSVSHRPSDPASGHHEPRDVPAGTPWGADPARRPPPQTAGADDGTDEPPTPATPDIPATADDGPHEPPTRATSDVPPKADHGTEEPPTPATPDIPAIADVAAPWLLDDPDTADLPDTIGAGDPPGTQYPLGTQHDLGDEVYQRDRGYEGPQDYLAAADHPRGQDYEDPHGYLAAEDHPRSQDYGDQGAQDYQGLLGYQGSHSVTDDAADTPATPASPVTPVPAARPATSGTAGTSATPGPPGPPGAPPPMAPRDRRRLNWSAVLAIALLAVIGFGAYALVSRGNSPKQSNAAAENHAGRHTPSPSRPTASPSPERSAPPALQTLSPVSIAAFGPDGAGQGDNPQLAQYALDDNAANPWHSDWYSSPQFGNLQPGTGLLLDMGKTVTIAAAQVAVGDVTGADIELRVGATPALSGLPPAAQQTGVGGTVQLRLTAAAQGRYALVWFTKLPQDQSGTFQASVYDVKLQGHT